ncbi:MAG TPA: redoxin family protein [Terracidiphilus sp.]|nr:redoxin family protein [Terracidiphilus sp.]
MGSFACALAAFVVLSPSFAISQNNPSQKPSSGLELLKQVEQHYADAKSYSIAATQERSQTGKYLRIWDKTVLTAAEAPGGKYRFEGRGNTGTAVRKSDGKTVWTYHIEENHYTAMPVSEKSTKSPGMFLQSESALNVAQYQRNYLAHLTHSLQSASILPEENVKVDGKTVRCVVVRVRNSDEDRPDPGDQFERTIWISKQQQVVVKIESRSDVRHVNVPRGPSLHQVTTTTYTKTVLNESFPDAEFTFVPPPGAVLLASFPDPMDGPLTMTGDRIPALELKTADGKTVPFESFQGKPVLIDFWATWCAPCLAEMPKLAEIYKEGKDKGLVLISIDQDEDAAKATAFLAKHGYDWPNFHDGDQTVAKLMGNSPLPRVVLVDAKGQIVYDTIIQNESRLRMHLAKLGPEFRDFAPKPHQPGPGAVTE